MIEWRDPLDRLFNYPFSNTGHPLVPSMAGARV